MLKKKKKKKKKKKAWLANILGHVLMSKITTVIVHTKKFRHTHALFYHLQMVILLPNHYKSPARYRSPSLYQHIIDLEMCRSPHHILISWFGVSLYITYKGTTNHVRPLKDISPTNQAQVCTVLNNFYCSNFSYSAATNIWKFKKRLKIGIIFFFLYIR